MNFLFIINFAVRVIVILVGLVVLFDLLKIPNLDTQARIIMGVVITLFGAYRLSIFYMQNKRYNFNDDDDDDE
ncbi:MAG: hypothetical protein ACOVNU_06000 [Candidatus Kapaibacteriota bacterium]